MKNTAGKFPGRIHRDGCGKKNLKLRLIAKGGK